MKLLHILYLAAALVMVLSVSACGPGTVIVAPTATPAQSLLPKTNTSPVNPPSTQPGVSPLSPVPTPAHAPKAVFGAQQALAQQLGVSPDVIRIVSAEYVEWRDACLGINTPGMMCAQVISPGYRVILEAGGKRYEYHTDASGNRAVPVPDQLQPAPTPGATKPPVLTWRREGGIAGFCDDVTIAMSGDYTVSSCKGNATREVGKGQLPAEQMAQVVNWFTQYQPFSSEQKDPAQADAMTIRLQFAGKGQGQVTAADKQAMLDLASKLAAQFK